MTLLSPTGLTPHGFCLLWDPQLLTWMMLGDGLTAASYFWIPFQLARAAMRGSVGLVMTNNSTVRALFALFILLCGIGHVMSVVTLFWPYYWIEASISVATGAVSFVTAAMLEFVFHPAAAPPEEGLPHAS